MLRCEICNYTTTEGSDLRDVAPTRKNSVRWSERYKGFLCWACRESIHEVATEYKIADELSEDTSALPVREEF